MVRKQNERTVLLQSRIIPLSLPTKSFFHILAPLAPFPQDWGLSFSPKHFPTNFFRNFFTKGRLTFCCIFGAKNYVFLGRTFFYFFGAKNYGGKGLFSLPKWGGVVTFCRLSIYQPAYINSGIFRSPPALRKVKRYRIRAKQGKNKFLFGRFCLTLVILETTNGKNLRYF